MVRQKFFLISSIITCYLIQAQGADKYADENRPYEFGFTIDGQQHRHEEKDKNGIIKGEYGFITADGVYHVTVYATDEQGRFKILSMKNIRYQDYLKGLTGTSSSARQGHSLQLPSSQTVTTRQSPNSIPTPSPKPQEQFGAISLEPPANSCSHCSLPTTSTVPPRINPLLTNQQNGGSNLPSVGNTPYSPSFYPKQEANFNAQSPQTPLVQSYPSTQNNPQQGVGQFPNAQPNNYNGGQNSIQTPNLPAKQTSNYGIPNGLQALSISGRHAMQVRQQQPVELTDNAERSRSGKQYTGTPGAFTSGQQSSIAGSGVQQAGPSPNEKPVLAYAQMQIVDKNTDIYAKGPGEKDGLPPGLKEDDMLKLLYTFNYTLGFQAHFEEGFTNGAKRGYYYTTGRNGLRTRIDYVADKDGFRPTLSQEVLDVLSDDVPKKETEKEEKYGLKGYEFKWLYFPADTSS